MLNIDLKSAGGAIIARLSGELDRSAREPLLKAVRTEAEASGGKVVLDCANLSSLDSEGVRALLALQTWLRIKDSEMAIAALPAKLEETIKSDSGVDQFLARHPSVNDALTSLGLQAAAPEPPAAPAAPPASPPPAATNTPPPSSGPSIDPPGGGWGPPPVAPEPKKEPSASSPPISETQPPVETRGPWESPIPTPEPVASPSKPSVPAPEESEVEAPKGTWGAPPSAASSAPERPETPAPTPWAKGPPPRREQESKKKSKAGFIIGGIVAALIVGLIIWCPWCPPDSVIEASTLRPQEYVIQGVLGEAPSPSEAVFSLSNVAMESIGTSPERLPSWVSLETQGTNASCEVVLRFTTINEAPSGELERGFHVEATGLDKQLLTGLIHFQIREPNVITFEPHTPRAGEVGQRYSDYIRVKGGGALFSTDPGSLPPGIELTPEGTLTGVPQAEGDYTFQVTASRDSDQPASKTYTIAVAPERPPETNSEDVAELIQMIVYRIGNLDKAAMSKDVLPQYERLEAYLGQILKDPVNHVKPAVTVTFPVGRVTVDAVEVVAQLEDPELEEWLSNRDTQLIIAGFADTSGNPDRNKTLIELRAKNLETVIEDWLVKEYRETRDSANERVTVVPNKPSDVFNKSRAAECWLFRPPAS